MSYERHKLLTSRQINETIKKYVIILKNKPNQSELGDLRDELIKTMIIIRIHDELTSYVTAMSHLHNLQV